MHILWCGTYLNDRTIKENRVVDLAAEKWTRGFLGALRDKGIKITVLSHSPAQLWPRGNVFWQSSDKELFLSEDECIPIGYPNLPFIREKYLANMYAKSAKEIFHRKRIDAVICYNLYCFGSMMKLAHKWGVPVFPIILDADDPHVDNWEKLTYDTRNATGLAFLSWWAIQNFPNARKVPLLHLDGGCDKWNGGAKYIPHKYGEPYRFVYTGSLDKCRGVNLLSEIVKKSTRKDIRFILCGNKFDKTRIWEQFGCDSRVDVRGLVSEKELMSICQSADVFLNMRNPKMGANLMNYPSKIPHYMSFGKPVISTWIDSFFPDYRSVLRVPKGDSADAFITEIEDVLSSYESQGEHCFNEIKEWFEKRMLWTSVAQRLLQFINTCDLKKTVEPRFTTQTEI